MTTNEKGLLNDSILSCRQVLLLLFLGRPFSPRPSVISGGGDQKRERKGGWWAGMALGLRRRAERIKNREEQRSLKESFKAKGPLFGLRLDVTPALPS